MYCAWWKTRWWDTFAFDIVSYTNFHSSSYSSFTLIPPSVSYFCLTVPSGLVSRSSICQHHPGGWQSGWGPGERHQTWDAGLGSPPSHLYLSCWLLHLSAHDLKLAVAGQKERPSTNDNLRINTQVREGRRKRAESLFHHPSASVGLLINLWSLHLPLFLCLSLISTHFQSSNLQRSEVIWPFVKRLRSVRSFVELHFLLIYFTLIAYCKY